VPALLGLLTVPAGRRSVRAATSSRGRTSGGVDCSFAARFLCSHLLMFTAATTRLLHGQHVVQLESWMVVLVR
jgi:hypothetical protein